MIPNWFKMEVGFKFLDPDGDLCVFLGEAGYRTTEAVPLKAGDVQIGSVEKLVFKPMTCLVFAYLYKREWHLSHLNQEVYGPEWWEKCRPA